MYPVEIYLTGGLHPRRRVDGVAEQTVPWDFHADHSGDDRARMNAYINNNLLRSKIRFDVVLYKF